MRGSRNDRTEWGQPGISAHNWPRTGAVRDIKSVSSARIRESRNRADIGKKPEFSAMAVSPVLLMDSGEEERADGSTWRQCRTSGA